MTCRKIAFFSRKEAAQAIKHTRKKLRPYHCRYCGNWHLTSKTRKQYRKNLSAKQEKMQEQAVR